LHKQDCVKELTDPVHSGTANTYCNNTKLLTDPVHSGTASTYCNNTKLLTDLVHSGTASTYCHKTKLNIHRAKRYRKGSSRPLEVIQEDKERHTRKYKAKHNVIHEEY
jgi:hypothetical protein